MVSALLVLQGGILAGIRDGTPAMVAAVRSATAYGMGEIAGRVGMG